MLRSGKTSTNNFLIRQLPKATAFVNKFMEIVYASDKWMQEFDCPNHNTLGKPINKLFQNPNKNWSQLIENAINNGLSITTKGEYVDTKGNKKWYQIKSTPWHDENENVIGTILQTKDVTKEVSDEVKLEKLQIMSEQMSDIANIGLWDYSLEKDEMTWSTKTKKIYQVEEQYCPTFLDTPNFFKIGFSRNTIYMAIDKAINQAIPFREKLQLITAKNKEIWVIISGKPIFKNKKMVGLVGTLQDIDEINSAEIKRRENEHLLRTLIDNLPLNVFIKDLESRKILVNKAEVEFCGAKNENEILGKDDFAIYGQKFAEKTRKADLKVMREHKPILGEEVSLIKQDGKSATFLTSKIPLIDEDGHSYGLVGISMDISELKRKEIELRELINITSSQNERLINFAHIVSHNLRSHSANFSMLLNFLKTEESQEEKDKILQMLISSSDNLMETLNNLNEVVDINSKQELRKEPINLKSKIDSFKEILSADIKNYNVKIINKVAGDIDLNVVPTYLHSILNNFLTNSINFRSPDRDPIIELEGVKEGKFYVLTVKDNGLGMDLKNNRDRLFGMYKTFHNNENSRGIGLYITKNQIIAMKGKVSVSSEVGIGTTFKIYFNEED